MPRRCQTLLADVKLQKAKDSLIKQARMWKQQFHMIGGESCARRGRGATAASKQANFATPRKEMLSAIWEFPKIRGTLFGVLIIRI